MVNRPKGMWLVTNLKTDMSLLFTSVKEWQTFTDYHNWTRYSIQFVPFGKEE